MIAVSVRRDPGLSRFHHHASTPAPAPLELVSPKTPERLVASVDLVGAGKKNDPGAGPGSQANRGSPREVSSAARNPRGPARGRTFRPVARPGPGRQAGGCT